jgi:hypothetical protein
VLGLAPNAIPAQSLGGPLARRKASAAGCGTRAAAAGGHPDITGATGGTSPPRHGRASRAQCGK